jgi:phosphopantothenoylcysteine synthetase/decarboxylase
MSRLTKKDRLTILEFASEIASESAQNPNVVWMIEFQEQLVEALYRKMTDLIESDLARAEEEEEDDEDDDDEDDDDEDDDDEDDENMEPTEVAEFEADDEIKKKRKEKKSKKAA